MALERNREQAAEREAPVEVDAIPPAAMPSLPPGRRAAAAFIFLTITLDILAMGMIAPVLPKLIEGFVAGSAEKTAEWMGLFGTVWAVAQFVCSPVLGALSDRLGRRPVVLLSNLGLGLDYCVMALAPSLPWLFAGRIISGVTASSIPTAMAYAADVTPPEKRAQSFGMLSGAFGIGFVLGPALGGILGNISPRLPFWVSAALSLLNFCYGMFVLPESLAKEHRRPFRWGNANPIGSLGLLKRDSVLKALAVVLLLGYLSQQCLMNVFVLYTDFRYGWTPRTTGLSLAVVGVCSAIAGAGLVKPAIKALGERKTMLLGLLMGSAGYVVFGAASVGTYFWLGIPLLCGMSLVWPTAQSVMSRQVGPSQQGLLQGSINSLRGLTGIVGPGMYMWVFARSVGSGAPIHLAGLAFFLAAMFVATEWVIAFLVTRNLKPAVQA